MKKKECSKCHEKLALTLFSKDINIPTGYRNTCKKCRNARLRDLYPSRKFYIQEKARLNRAKNSKERNKNAAIYRKLNTKKEKIYRNAYRIKHKAKIKARDKICQIYRRKKLPRKCVICGKLNAEIHHSDYTKPLEIILLCKKHHAAWHRIFLTEQG